MHIISTLLIITIITFFMIKDVQLIINGIRADLRDFPYIASLHNMRLGHLCGSAVISQRHVLTAAHCVYREEESNWVLRLGIVDLNDRGGDIFMVHKFHVHGSYEPKKVRKMTDQEKSEALARDGKLSSDEVMIHGPKHDIAIVETRRDFDYSLLALPLPRSQEFREDIENLGIAMIKLVDKRPDSCAICIFAGWGNSVEVTENPSATTRLMYLIIRVHDSNDCCREECPSETGLFCAQHPARNAAPSFGDSGGPLVCGGRLAGILSNGDPGIDGPALYSDVTHYREWIDGIISKKPRSRHQNN